jgi:hypothetical protein
LPAIADDRRVSQIRFEANDVPRYFRPLTLFAVLSVLVMAVGCAWIEKKPSPGEPDVPQCRQAANAVSATDFDTRESVLHRRADAYSDCMQAHGYVLDEAELDRKLLYQEQVINSEPLGGDPAPFLALYRQELRLNPTLWRPGSR